MFTPGTSDNFDAWQAQQQEQQEQQGTLLRRPNMVSRGSQASERMHGSQEMQSAQNVPGYPYVSPTSLSNTATPPLDAPGRLGSEHVHNAQQHLSTQNTGNGSNSQNTPASFASPPQATNQGVPFAASFTLNNALNNPSTPVPLDALDMSMPQLNFPPAASPFSPVPPVSTVSSVPPASTVPGGEFISTKPTPPMMAPALSSLPAQPPQVMKPPSLKLPSISPSPRMATSHDSSTEHEDEASYEHAIDFAMQSWDLATGGLKTMTAKRELPTRQDRKAHDLSIDESLERTSRNYTFALIILGCVILMLMGCGVVLFVMLQR